MSKVIITGPALLLIIIKNDCFEYAVWFTWNNGGLFFRCNIGHESNNCINMMTQGKKLNLSLCLYANIHTINISDYK